VPGEIISFVQLATGENVSQVIQSGRLGALAAGAERVQVGLGRGGQAGVKPQLFFGQRRKGLFLIEGHISPFENNILKRNYNKISVLMDWGGGKPESPY